MALTDKKIALVTGASSGIGKATAEAILQKWPDVFVYLLARRKENLDKMVSTLGSHRCQAISFDVRDYKNAQNLAKEIGPVHFLINNAGLAAGLDLFQEADVSDWELMIDTNLKGLLYTTRAFLPKMIENGGGHIVNIGSIAGHEVYPKGHVYNATKFAVRALTQALRIDTLGKNIRITSIDPGMVNTEFSLVRFKGDTQKAHSVYEGLKPLQSIDIAEAIIWSLDRPSHVNIQEIVIMPTQQASVRDVYRE